MKKILSFLICYSLVLTCIFSVSTIVSAEESWLWPVPDNKTIYQPFKPKTSTDSGHSGLDISKNAFYVVVAVKSGVVKTSNPYVCSHFSKPNANDHDGSCAWKSSSSLLTLGNYIEIEHSDGTISRYAHLCYGFNHDKASTKIDVLNVGDYVTQGTPIGIVGSSGKSFGQHLHFTIIKNGSKLNNNPIDNTLILSANAKYSNSDICSGGTINYIGSVSPTINENSTSKPSNSNNNLHTCTKYETYKNGNKTILGACKECHTPFNWYEEFSRLSETYELQTKNYKVKIYKSPYEDAKCISSNKVIKNISVVGTLTNAYGSKWYAIAYNYQDDTDKQCYSTAYVYGKNIENNYRQTSSNTAPIQYSSANMNEQEHKHNYNFNNGMCYCGAVKATTPQTNAASTLKISLTKYPVQHKQGKNFGLRGSITSNYKIKKIYGYIKQNGNVIQSTEDTPNAKSVDVRDKKLNNNLVFETLGAGNYTLEVYAVDASGNGITVIKNFTVVGQAAKAESTLSINLDKYPVTLNAGSGFGLRGSISSNYNIALVKGYVINSSGQTVLLSKDTPNSTSMDIRYANLNNDLIFNNLGAGNYTMKVVATDNSGRTVEVSKAFSVVSNTNSNNSSLSINLEKYPVTLNVGSSYGLRGTITSNYNISVVRGYVINSNGQTVLSSKDTPNSTYMDIKPAHLNADLIFNNLSAGNYTMRVVAVDASGRTVEATKNFTVKAKDVYVDNSPNGNGVTGTVAIPSSWENLSIRSGPSTNYQIVGSMNNGAKCTVYPNKTSNGWYYVNYNGIWGYASGNQIKLNNSSNANTRTGIVNIPSSWTDLSIRTGPSTNYQIVGGMPHGARCTVYPDKASNGWYYVEYNGVSGYAAGNRINLQ